MNGCHCRQLKVVYYLHEPNNDNTMVQPMVDRATKYLSCARNEKELVVSLTTHNFIQLCHVQPR